MGKFFIRTKLPATEEVTGGTDPYIASTFHAVTVTAPLETYGDYPQMPEGFVAQPSREVSSDSNALPPREFLWQ